MEPHQVFKRYTRHQSGCDHPGFRREELAHLVRLTPTTPDGEGFVQLANLTRDNVDAAIDEQIAYFKALGFAFEWKHHDFNTPENLKERLLAHGFKPDDTEALMVYDVVSHEPWKGSLPDGIRVERIESIEQLGDVADANTRANNRPWPPLVEWLTRAFARMAIFCAYDGTEPIGSGWIEFPTGSEFAGIYGGGVVPAYRGKGVYSALFEIRVQEARQRGSPLLAVDAGPMSRPILLRKGFEFICETTPFRIPP